MNLDLWWDNIVAYSLQIGLLVALAALVPALLRLRLPGARLAYWQILLAVCLLLPALRSWKRVVIVDDTPMVSKPLAVAQFIQLAPARGLPRTEIALLLLAAGAVIRLGWLAVGFRRLRRYRRNSRPFSATQPWRTRAELRVSNDVSGPVTFGYRRPVVLLPGSFQELAPRMQDAIICHEILHVERRDWVFTVAEELVRAVFWFHPAIWWLLGEIQLSREQAVDRKVIELTQARDPYVDALLAIAGAHPQFDLAPAPLFLRKRHLKQRVVSILKEVRMSRTRLISALAAGLGMLAAACWFVTGTFPLAASPQIVRDAPGITVDIGAAQLMHRVPVGYPEDARKKGVQGAVTVEATLDGSGTVTDARVISGPQELRRGAVQSVFEWHFTKDAANSTRLVTIDFRLPPPGSLEPIGGVIGGVPGGVAGGVPGGVIGNFEYKRQGFTMAGQESESRQREIAAVEAKLKALASQQQQPDAQREAQIEEMKAKLVKMAEMAGRNSGGAPNTRTLKRISITGLPDSARDELRLPVHIGDALTEQSVAAAREAVSKYDPHLRFNFRVAANGDSYIDIGVPGAATLEPAAADGPRIKVGGNVQSAKLRSQPRPVYPPEAKQARISGVVHLMAIIAVDGTVKRLEVMDGHPLLVPSALDAVRQWVYEPTYLNGEPVEIETQIDVNFTLSQ
jgi:TonB family protein